MNCISRLSAVIPPSTFSVVSVEAGVGVHRVDHLAGLPAGRLEHSTRQVTLGDVRRQPDDHPARLASPVRREQAAERRHDVAAAVVVDRAGERLDLRRGGDQPELVAEPLHQRAGDRDRAFQRVQRGLVVDLVADRADQPVRRPDEFVAGVEQQEAAGAVRALGLARGEAGLAEQRGLLVAERGRDPYAGEADRRASRTPRRWSGSRGGSAAGCRRTRAVPGASRACGCPSASCGWRW